MKVFHFFGFVGCSFLSYLLAYYAVLMCIASGAKLRFASLFYNYAFNPIYF